MCRCSGCDHNCAGCQRYFVSGIYMETCGSSEVITPELPMEWCSYKESSGHGNSDGITIFDYGNWKYGHVVSK